MVKNPSQKPFKGKALAPGSPYPSLTATALSGKEPMARHFKKYWALYAMLALPLIYFILFKYLPMFGNILAFRRYKPGKSPWGEEWVGLRYFERLFSMPTFWVAFKNTLVLSFWNILVNFPLPILLAIVLSEARAPKFKKIVQTVSYMPRFISTVVVIAILSEILSPSSGILNRFLVDNFGKTPIYFTNDPKYFRLIYILSDSWQFSGWTAIIYLAAITGISLDLYEAADIDGASRIQKIIYVTIPSVMPTIMVMLILQVGRMLSLGFEKVLLLYTNSNAGVSDILDTLIYRTGLANQNYSLSSAMGLFTGIVGLILVSSANFFSRKVTGESVY